MHLQTGSYGMTTSFWKRMVECATYYGFIYKRELQKPLNPRMWLYTGPTEWSVSPHKQSLTAQRHWLQKANKPDNRWVLTCNKTTHAINLIISESWYDLLPAKFVKGKIYVIYLSIASVPTAVSVTHRCATIIFTFTLSLCFNWICSGMPSLQTFARPWWSWW